ncbi:MAG TPA: uracil-DNA glycosylase family protein [Kofleriaceae bacterium]|nr:uracil-DNA glycosylase family protein [Kofleriaceae bacterium]
MKVSFDLGYIAEPYLSLCDQYPDSSVYPAKDFRVEWGPIFHRGRLDGSARVLVIGQDPATHEAITRRILVGEAGQRVQGFLAKLGITSSYVMINTFLYSVYGQGGGMKHKNDPAIIEYRNRWIDAIFAGAPIEAVVALGTLADGAFKKWKQTPAGQANDVAYEHITHPTYPNSVSGGNATSFADAMKQMLANWNAALQRLAPKLQHPDVAQPLVLYGTGLSPGELAEIPLEDLPAGLPTWMRSLDSWAVRRGETPDEKRATIVVTVPKDARPPTT